MSVAASVFVVDDDVMVRDVVGRYLGRAGYQVTVAGDGVYALRVAQDRLPDLVVLDLMRPTRPRGVRRDARRTAPRRPDRAAVHPPRWPGSVR